MILRTIPLVLASAACLGIQPAGGQILERILLKVNGDPITKTELERRQLVTLRRQSGRAYSWEEIRSDASLQQTMAHLTPQIVADAIDELLVIQRGRELGYQVTPADIDGVLQTIKAENDATTEAEFGALLARESLDLPELRALLARQIMIQRVREVEVFRRIHAGEEEAGAFYQARQEEFARPPSVTFREIAVDIPPERRDGNGAARAARDAALVRFVRARERVSNGTPFDAVAREFSDAPSRAHGGLVGPVDPRDLPDSVRRALSTLKPGDLSQPVSSDGTYRVLKLESATAGRAVAFEDVRTEVIERALAEKRGTGWERYLERLRSTAIVEWKSPDLQRAYAQYMTRR